MASEELLACPFCGGSRIATGHCPLHIATTCHDCGAQAGINAHIPKTAWKMRGAYKRSAREWNTRAVEQGGGA